MPDYDAIASTEYVVEGYVEAHDELQQHDRTGSETALRRAAAALCRALTRLETDDAFWDEVASVRWSSQQAEDLPEPLRDLDVLLGVERDILIEAGVPPGAVDEILRDAGAALNAYAEWPDEFAASQVREALATAARAACMEATFRRRSQRPTRRLWRASQAAAGSVIIFANGAVAPHGVTELSIVLGEIVIFRSAEPEARF